MEHRNVRDEKNSSIKRILEKEEQDMEDKFTAIGFSLDFSIISAILHVRADLAKPGGQTSWCSNSAV